MRERRSDPGLGEFDSLIDAFATFDGRIVGRCFVAPGVALKRDGTVQGFSTQRDVEACYQAALDRYRASGCRSCRYSELEIRFLNGKSAIATASWDLLREDGSTISHWRQAYFMSQFGASGASTALPSSRNEAYRVDALACRGAHARAAFFAQATGQWVDRNCAESRATEM